MLYLLLMTFERRRTDFARDRFQFFDKGRRRAELECLLDAVQLLLDLCVVVARHQYYAVQQIRLGEWLFPVWLVGPWFDGVADGAWTGCITDRVCLHAVCVVAVGRVADVFGKNGRYLHWSVL